MTTADLTAHALSFSYGRGSLTIEVPEFAATPGVHHIVGLNGSGKTTFLKLLTGLLLPRAGEVSFRGRPLSSQEVFREYCRASGYLWQNFQLRGGTTARQFLEYRAWLHGIDARDCADHAVRSLAAVGLLDAAETAVGKLSGGMQRRVGLAAETIHAPRVLLLDEPCSGLDYRARDLAHETLESLAGGDSTIVVVAHEPEDVARYDSTVHVMSEGTIVSSSPFAAGEVTAAVLRELTEDAAR